MYILIPDFGIAYIRYVAYLDNSNVLHHVVLTGEEPQIQVIDTQGKKLWNIKWDSQGRYLAMWCTDGGVDSVLIWKQQNKTWDELTASRTAYYSLCWSPGQAVLATDHKNSVSVWDVETRLCLTTNSINTDINTVL